MFKFSIKTLASYAGNLFVLYVLTAIRILKKIQKSWVKELRYVLFGVLANLFFANSWPNLLGNSYFYIQCYSVFNVRFFSFNFLEKNMSDTKMNSTLQKSPQTSKSLAYYSQMDYTQIADIAFRQLFICHPTVPGK